MNLDENKKYFKFKSMVLKNNFALMQTFRRENKFCDVNLKVGDKILPAHRNVLAAAIPYFHSMFTSNMLESESKEINIKDIEPSALESIMEVAYGGEVRIDEENVKKLLEASSFVVLFDLRDACVDFLVSMFNVENVLEIKYFADSKNCTDLVMEADAYIRYNFSKVAITEAFLSLELEELIDFIKEDELQVESEETVFEACMAWVYHDEDLRSPSLSTILRHVRLPLLTPQYLHARVGKEKLIKASTQCRELLGEDFFHSGTEFRFEMKAFQSNRRGFRFFYAIGWDAEIEGYSEEESRENRGEGATFDIYDPFLNKWKFGGRMPIEASYFSVAVLEEKMYVFGGFNEGCLSSVNVYDPEEKTWFEAESLLTKRCNAGVAVLNNCAYICGGENDHESLKSVECYCLTSNAWRGVTPMLYRRQELCVVVLGGYLYAIGGCENNFDDSLNTVERFDPATNVWTNVNSMITGRAVFGAAPLNGKIYVCGGKGSSGITLQTVEVYDPCTDEWEQVSQMNCKRYAFALTANMNKIYAIGGINEGVLLSSVEAYDPRCDTWSFVRSMNKERSIFGVAVL